MIVASIMMNIKSLIRRTTYAISQLATTRNMPDDVCENIINKILAHKNK